MRGIGLRAARALLAILVGVGASMLVGQADSVAQPATLTQFLTPPPRIHRQLDGSAVCLSWDGIFVADGDPRRWSAAPCLSDEICAGSVIGGDRHRLFVLSPDGDGYRSSLYAVDLDSRKITVVKSGLVVAARLAGFASGDIGAYCNYGHRSTLALTTDGGTTWRVTPPLLPKKKPLRPLPRLPGSAVTVSPSVRSYAPPTPGAPAAPLSGEVAQTISGLLWVSPSRLLVGGSEGTVRLFEVRPDGLLQQVWSVDLPVYAGQFTIDDDHVWIGSNLLLRRLRLADGRTDATVKLDSLLYGAAACHEALLTWNSPGSLPPCSSSFGIWTRDPKLGYICRAKIRTRYLDVARGHLGMAVAGVLPLEAPLCLMITGRGAGFLLDLDKATLSPVALRITPPPPAPPGSKAEIWQTSNTQNSLMWQIPRAERDAISAQWIEKTDLAIADRNRWAIRELRRYIEAEKPRVLDFRGAAGDDDLPHVEGLAQLEYLYLYGNRITDTGLAHLAGADRLRCLDLRHARVSGAGLAHLRASTELRRLDLSGAPAVTDAGLAGLNALPQLEELLLARTKIGDAAMPHLAGLTRLRELDLACTRITDAGLERLTGLTHLRKLELSATNLTDAGLSHLKGFTELRSLGLFCARSERIVDGRAVLDREAMRRAGIGIMQITDAGLEHLAGLTRLRRLDLGGSRITDAGLECLKGLTRLQWLNVNATKVTDEGLRNLRHFLPNCRFGEPGRERLPISSKTPQTMKRAQPPNP